MPELKTHRNAPTQCEWCCPNLRSSTLTMQRLQGYSGVRLTIRLNIETSAISTEALRLVFSSITEVTPLTREAPRRTEAGIVGRMSTSKVLTALEEAAV